MENLHNLEKEDAMNSSGELLREYLEQQPEKIKDVRNFCNVASKTVRSWLKGTNPKGITQCRLFVYLLEQQLAPAELLKTEPDIILLAVLVAHDYVSSQEAMKVMGSTSKSDQQLWGWIRSDTQPLPKALELLQDWLDAVDGDRSRRLIAAEFLGTTTVAEQSPANVIPLSFDSSDQIIENLAALLSAVYPLAKRVEADDFSNADRERLRALIGEDQFFKLTNALTRLSGTKARSYTQSI
jgi:hypothetical protein